jgi:hypothetical protein
LWNFERSSHANAVAEQGKATYVQSTPNTLADSETPRAAQRCQDWPIDPNHLARHRLTHAVMGYVERRCHRRFRKRFAAGCCQVLQHRKCWSTKSIARRLRCRTWRNGKRLSSTGGPREHARKSHTSRLKPNDDASQPYGKRPRTKKSWSCEKVSTNCSFAFG